MNVLAHDRPLAEELDSAGTLEAFLSPVFTCLDLAELCRPTKDHTRQHVHPRRR